MKSSKKNEKNALRINVRKAEGVSRTFIRLKELMFGASTLRNEHMFLKANACLKM